MLAVIVSVTDARSSARLLADIEIPDRLLVRFTPHPVAVAADSAAPAISPDVAADTVYQSAHAWVPARAPPRWSGGLSVEHSSSAYGSAATTSQSIIGADADVRAAAPVRLLLRGHARQRGGSTRAAAGATDLETIVYQAEVRLGPAGESWLLSLGRMMDHRTGALGYLDGGRLEVRIAPAHHVGIGAGFAPGAERFQLSSELLRAGAWWRFSRGGALDGSLSAAAEWGGGRRRRTSADLRTWLRLGTRGSVSVFGTVDFPVDGTPVDQARLTTLYASINSTLPFGFRGGLAAESHQAFVPWHALLQPDTLLVLPGRLTGGTATLGRSFGGFSLDASAGVQRRAGEPGSTRRATLSLSGGGLFGFAGLQQGDLLEYRQASLRWLVPARPAGFTLALGASASMMRTTGGAVTTWRYGVRPEISRQLGRGIFASAGGEFGRWAGTASRYLHAGVSYRFR